MSAASTPFTALQIILVSLPDNVHFIGGGLAEFLGLPPIAKRELRWSELANCTLDQLVSGKIPLCKLKVIDHGSGSQLEFEVKSVTPIGDLFLVQGINRQDALTFARILHGQRMETLGTLAGGIAHDFNNILTGILGHTSYLKNLVGESSNHLSSLAAIEDGARRASRLTAEILRFTRDQSKSDGELVDLRELLSRTFELLRGAIPPNYKMILKVPEEPVLFYCPTHKLTQVILNLVMNAKDAVSPSGGEIGLELAVEHRGGKKFVSLVVADNGCGISEEIRTRIFEPYFSTKGDAGTGLGLSIVKMVVDQLNGEIFIDSIKNKRTRFQIFFPLSNNASNLHYQSLAIDSAGFDSGVMADHRSNRDLISPAPSPETLSILVADDDPSVLETFKLGLQHLGYQVTLAKNGIEALTIYKNNPNDFDLLILDLLMPNGDGEEVFLKVRAINPDQRVLFCSGFAPPETINRVLSVAGTGFLPKPFTIGDLSTKMKECLSLLQSEISQ